MALLAEIDRLREEAARLAKESRDCTPGEIDNYRSTLQAVEEKIEGLLQRYWALPLCPYPPCLGRLEPTPTKYVMRCTHCNATALPGKMVILTHAPPEGT